MRKLMLAVAAGLGLAALGGAAFADTFHDSQNRVTVTTPAGWRLVDQSNAQHTYMVLGSASNECDVFAIPRAEWTSLTAAAAKQSAGRELTPESWVTTSNTWINGSSAVTGFTAPSAFVSQSIDSASFFPSQRAEMTSANGNHFHAAHLMRPGLEIFAYCLTYTGADNMSLFDGVIRSISTPHDAQWQAEAAAAPAAAVAAPAAAPAATPAPAHH